jgi:hypothetical protein
VSGLPPASVKAAPLPTTNAEAHAADPHGDGRAHDGPTHQPRAQPTHAAAGALPGAGLRARRVRRPSGGRSGAWAALKPNWKSQLNSRDAIENPEVTNTTKYSWDPRRESYNFLPQLSSHPSGWSAAKGSSTTVSRSDIRLIQYLDSPALGLVRRWLYIGYFPIHSLPKRVVDPTRCEAVRGARRWTAIVRRRRRRGGWVRARRGCGGCAGT